MIADERQRDRHVVRRSGAKAEYERVDPGRHRHRHGEDVVGEQRDARHLGGQQTEVVLGDDVRATGRRVGLDRLPVGQDQEEEHDHQRDRDRQRRGRTRRSPPPGSAPAGSPRSRTPTTSRLSDANTASAVGMPSRSCSSSSVCSGARAACVFNRYRRDSGDLGLRLGRDRRQARRSRGSSVDVSLGEPRRSLKNPSRPHDRPEGSRQDPLRGPHSAPAVASAARRRARSRRHRRVIGVPPVRDNVTVATVALVLVVAWWRGHRRRGARRDRHGARRRVTLNLAFLRPYGTLKVASVDDGIALVVFVVVALLVGQLVTRSCTGGPRSSQASEQVRALDRESPQLHDERSHLRASTDPRRGARERSTDQRSALLRSVSHDLRTPLASIRAVATDLRDGVDYDDVDPRRAAHHGVRRSRAARPLRRQPAQPQPHRGRRVRARSGRRWRAASW